MDGRIEIVSASYYIPTEKRVSREIDFANTCQIQIDIQDLPANSLMWCHT